MNMTLTFKAYNEICDLAKNICGVNEDVAEILAASVMDIVQNGGVVDIETASDRLETIMNTLFTTGEVIPL